MKKERGYTLHLLNSGDVGCAVSGLSRDFEGDIRPFDGTSEPRGDGSDYDIGADEYFLITDVSIWSLYY